MNPLTLSENPFATEEDIEDNDEVDIESITPKKFNVTAEEGEDAEEKQQEAEENFKKSITTQILENFERYKTDETPEKVYKQEENNVDLKKTKKPTLTSTKQSDTTTSAPSSMYASTTNNTPKEEVTNKKKETFETPPKKTQNRSKKDTRSAWKDLGERALKEMESLKGMGNKMFKQEKIVPALNIYKSAIKVGKEFLEKQVKDLLEAYKLSDEAMAHICKNANTIEKFFQQDNLSQLPEVKSQYSKDVLPINYILEDFKTIIPQLEVTSILVYQNIGTILLKQDKIEEAINQFKCMLSINPSCANAHHRLAMCFEKQKELQKAHKHANEALVLDGTNTTVHDLVNRLTTKLDKQKSNVKSSSTKKTTDEDGKEEKAKGNDKSINKMALVATFGIAIVTGFIITTKRGRIIKWLKNRFHN